MHDIIQKLKGGDRRSIGRSEEIVREVLDNPNLFDELIHAILIDDPIVRMRAADALEKVTTKNQAYLQPYKDLILNEIAEIEQQEVRWHIAQILPRLEMNEEETERAIEILKGYLLDDSRIVRTFTMDSLAHFAEMEPSLETWVISLIEEMVEDGSPGMKARGKKLLSRLRGRKKPDE